MNPEKRINGTTIQIQVIAVQYQRGISLAPRAGAALNVDQHLER